MQEAVDLGLAVSAQAAADLTPAGEGAALASTAAPALSPREQEVLDLLCQHWTAPEIADKLFVSPRTVESHIAHIYDKLGVTTRRDALAAVARQALAAPDIS
jgi:DNA-binding CsgD family transcriptional regulator